MARRLVALAAALVLGAAVPATASRTAPYTPVETVLVDVASEQGTMTAAPLDAGRTYWLEVSGVYEPGNTPLNGRNAFADAECSSQDGFGARWSAEPTYSWLDDDLDLLAYEGPPPSDPWNDWQEPVVSDWTPTNVPSPTDAECSGSHTYLARITGAGQQLRFAIRSYSHTGYSGALAVRIFTVWPASSRPLP